MFVNFSSFFLPKFSETVCLYDAIPYGLECTGKQNKGIFQAGQWPSKGLTGICENGQWRLRWKRQRWQLRGRRLSLAHCTLMVQHYAAHRWREWHHYKYSSFPANSRLQGILPCNATPSPLLMVNIVFGPSPLGILLSYQLEQPPVVRRKTESQE